MIPDLGVLEEAMRLSRTTDDVDAVLREFVAMLERDYEAWCRFFFPDHFTRQLAPHHRELWEWVWSLKDGERVEPFVGIWPRGGAKSTTAELATAAVGARKTRRYVLYCCGTQGQADEHVQNIGGLLESDLFAEMYPDVARPKVGEYGTRRGWRRTRLAAQSGFTVDAVGLDTAMRGVKIDADRPDLIVFDDLDDSTDSAHVTARKVNRLTRSLLPTGAEHYTVLGIQNLVLPNGVMARIAGVSKDAEAGEVLSSARVSGPIPAVYDLQLALEPDPRSDGRLHWVITGGWPSWPDGQSLERCQMQIGDWGKTAFLIEAQHEVHLRSGGMFHAFDWMSRTRPDGTRLLVPGPFPTDDPMVVRIRAWDTAATEPTGENDPDWTVGVLMALHLGRKVYRIEDVERFRSAAGTVKTRIRETTLGDTARFARGRYWVGVETEPGPYGRDRAYEWVHDTLAGFNVVRLKPSGSKTERAVPLAAAMENMLVEIAEHGFDGTPTWDVWVKEFLTELEAFGPEGIHDHDDQVDAAAHAFNWLQRRLLSGVEMSTAADAMQSLRL